MIGKFWIFLFSSSPMCVDRMWGFFYTNGRHYAIFIDMDAIQTDVLTAKATKIRIESSEVPYGWMSWGKKFICIMRVVRYQLKSNLKTIVLKYTSNRICCLHFFFLLVRRHKWKYNKNFWNFVETLRIAFYWFFVFFFFLL